jgi:hypothetical protein
LGGGGEGGYEKGDEKREKILRKRKKENILREIG